MTGNEVYEQKFINRINGILNENKDLDFLQSFINSVGQKSYSTIHVYLCCVVKFMRYINKPPHEIKYEDYTNYLASIKNQTSSAQIVNYSALKKLSKYFVLSEKTDKDYMSQIEKPKNKEGIETIKKRDVGYLTENEIQKYLQNVSNSLTGESKKYRKRTIQFNERDLAIINIFLFTGMRCSALFKLDVNSVDLSNKKIITIDKEETVQEHFIPQSVVFAIENWLERRNELMKGEKETALFVTANKERMSTEAIYHTVNKYAFNIDGKNITPHKLRATYGTMLYAKTHDIYIVQECMGHKSPKTSEMYIRGQKEKARKFASDILDEAYLFNKKGEDEDE